MGKNYSKLSKKALNAAKELVIKYRSITPEDVDKALSSIFPRQALANITGFGSSYDCLLCRASNMHVGMMYCNNCIHGYDKQNADIIPCTLHRTFDYLDKVIDNKDKEEYLLAVKARAHYIEKRIRKYESIINKEK